MDRTRRQALAAVTAAPVITVAAFGRATAAGTAADLTPDEARAIAREVFLWGMHPVAIYFRRYDFAQNPKSPRFAGLNRLQWSRKPVTALPRRGTTPNASTLYGTAMLDLSKEPVVVTVPAVKGRYWSVQFHDNYARWWGLSGSQFNAPGPVRRLLIGPNWTGRLPADFIGDEVVQSTSDFAGALVRLALTDDTAAELRTLNGLQDRITLMPLSQWLAAGRREVRAEDLPVTPGAYPTFPGMDAASGPGRLRGLDFLRWVSLVLNDPTFTKQADGHAEIEAFARFERLGLRADQPFDGTRLPPAIQAAIEAGIEDGRNEVLAFVERGAGGIDMNGWSLTTDLQYHDSDWLQRAYYGLIAILGPIPLRSHTGAICMRDDRGRPLSGEHRYTLTFDLSDLPPVTEFWEVPLYDREGYLVDNPINRYSLTSYMLQRGKLHTADGKLVIYVQNDAPTDLHNRKNWLPAPKGGFQFYSRYYGPYGPLIDGSYKMPAPVRVD